SMKSPTRIILCYVLVSIAPGFGCKSQQPSQAGAPDLPKQVGTVAPAGTQNPSSGLVGKWAVSIPNKKGESVGKIIMTFNPDGTEDQTVEGNGRSASLRATYTVESLLTQKLVKAQEGGKDIPLPDPGPKHFTVKVDGDKLELT